MYLALFELILFTNGRMSLHKLTEFKAFKSDVTGQRNRVYHTQCRFVYRIVVSFSLVTFQGDSIFRRHCA
jgi:hypothetical protein